MNTHATLSPSKRERWARCPASVKAEASYPPEDRGSNDAAVQGTHTHTLLAYVIEKNLKDAKTLIGDKMMDGDGEFTVDSARAERVAFAMSYLDSRLEALGTGTNMYSEVKVDPAPIFSRSDLRGTSDVIIINNDTVEIVDYKDGMGVVSADANLQMDQYAWGVVAQLGAVPQKTIRMTIIQPKLREKGLVGVSYVEMTMDEFTAGKEKLMKEAAATDSPDAPFVPGDAQCKYCRHKGACTALSDQTMAAMGLSFEKLDIVQQSADTEPIELSDAKIREILEAAPLIRQMLDGVEKEALKRLENGKSIEGLKLVQGRGSRAWGYPEDVIAEKLKKMGLPKDALWKTTLVSPAQVEKVVWKKRDGTQKQLSDKQLKLIAEEYVTKSTGKLQVAPVADSRPAVVRDVSSMFGAVGVVAPVVELPDWLK